MRLIDADELIVMEYGGIKFVPVEFINDAPTIDAVPVKHGKWIDVMTEDWCTFDECKCGVCGTVEYFNKGWKKFSYCPNCGARMEGGKVNEMDHDRQAGQPDVSGACVRS